MPMLENIVSVRMGAFAACASSKQRASVNREFRLDKAWADDVGRCLATLRPIDRTLATKGGRPSPWSCGPSLLGPAHDLDDREQT